MSKNDYKIAIMMEPQEIEENYQIILADLPYYLPDGIREVDLNLLQEFNLLVIEDEGDDEQFTHHFYVIESPEKLTLFNEKFIIWIVPKLEDETPLTYSIIALQNPEELKVEMAFITKGMFNHSGLILRVLEKFLEEIEENEEEIVKLKAS